LTGSGNVQTKQSPSIAAVGTTGFSSLIRRPEKATSPPWNKSNSRALTGDLTRSVILKDCTSDRRTSIQLSVNHFKLFASLHVHRNAPAVKPRGKFSE
jgi:hypothetical protein